MKTSARTLFSLILIAMETIIVQPGSKKNLEALKAFLQALKMDFRVATEPAPNVVTNPETLRRIEAYETGKSEPIQKTLEEIKALGNA